MTCRHLDIYILSLSQRVEAEFVQKNWCKVVEIQMTHISLDIHNLSLTKKVGVDLNK